MTCAMKHEAWTWYPPSHLVVAKILCSRYKPCTNNWLSFFLNVYLQKYICGSKLHRKVNKFAKKSKDC